MLSIKNISKVYKPKKGMPVTALRNVSIDFPDKGLVFVLGKSGSGKSTLLNTLGGLDSFDEGEIIIKGKSSKEFSGADFDSYRNTYLGFIFQEYNVLNDFNLEKNIKLALELQGKKGTEEEIAKLLAEVDLTGLEKRKVNELSGGQKQRIAIARALIKNPEIILADEPTGALDSATGIQVFDTLKKLSADKLVIVVSHDRDFAERYGDRVIIMKDGVIAEDTTKTYIDPKNLSPNVAQIGNDILHIKTDNLTAADVDKIVGILKKSKGEKIISMGAKENKEIHNALRFDADSKREAFGETPKSEIKPYTKNDFHLIKSKLRDRDALKMGVSSLKHKVVRLVFTIILTVVSLAMFGFFLTVSAYDKNRTLFDSISESGDYTVSVTKDYYYDWENDDSDGGIKSYDQYDWQTEQAKRFFNNDDIAKVQQIIGADKKLLPVYNVSQIYYSNHFSDSNKLNGWALNDYSGYNSAINIDDIEDPEWLGTAPTLPLADNEIIITDFYYDLYRIAGYRDNEGIKTTVNDYSNIIGKKIGDYTVRGVINTHFNFDRYREYYEVKENASADETIGAYVKIMELQTYLKKMPGAAIMTGDAIAAQNSIIPSDITFYDYTDDPSYPDNVNVEDIVGADNSAIIWADGKDKDTITATDIVVSSQSATSPTLTAIDPDTGDSFPDGKKRLRYYFDGGIGIKYYTMDTAGKAQFTTDINEYVRAQIAAELTRTIKAVREERTWNGNDFDITTIPLFNEDGSTQFTVVGYSGFYTDDWFNSANYDNDGNYRGRSDYYYRTYFNYAVFDDAEGMRIDLGAGSLVFDLPTERGAAIKIMDDITAMTNTGADNYITTFAVSTQFSPILDNFDSALTQVAMVFKWVALAFAIFAALMMMSYIGTSITFKKREIGILRALGARKGDVYRVFLYESAVVLLIEYILTIIGLFIAVFFVNRAVQNALGQTLTLLHFGILQMIIILAVGAVVVVASSILPTARIAGKKPIDAINNR